MTPPGADPADPAAPTTYEVYADGRANPRFTDWLRDRSEPAWTAATTHRFTEELAADELEDDVFRRYLVEDYAFVETLTATFGHAVGEAPTMTARSRLVDFLDTLTADENDYFERAFEALDVEDPIPDQERATEPEHPANDRELAAPTLSLRDLLGRASTGGYPELLAVLVPAEWVYLSWASAVADRSPSRFYLGEWIELHANAEFESFVEWLRTELDREGAAASPRRQRRLAAFFERTVDLEVAFFDAAYADCAAVDGVLAADGGGRRW